MATRAARESATKQNELHRLILTRVLNEDGNRICADCNERMPRWASWSLGIFFCLKCSGVHRSLGVHISKVKSVNLDTWTRDQVNHVANRGNLWANGYYLERHAKGPKFRIQEGDGNLSQFIRNKYEHKKYMRQGKAPDLVDRSELIAKCEQEIYGKATTKITPKLRPKPKVLLNNVNAVPKVQTKPQQASNDLLNIDFGDFSSFDNKPAAAATQPVVAQTQVAVGKNASAGDPFDFFGSNSASCAVSVQKPSFEADFGQMNITQTVQAVQSQAPATPVAQNNNNNNNDLFDVFNSTPITTATPCTTNSSQAQPKSSGNNQIMDIMSLFGNSTSSSGTVPNAQNNNAASTDLSSLANFGSLSKNENNNSGNSGLNFDPFAPVSQVADEKKNDNNNIDFTGFGSNPFGAPATNTTSNNEFVWN